MIHRQLKIIIILLLLLNIFSINAKCSATEDSEKYGIINEQYAYTDADKLIDSLPNETEQDLQNFGIYSAKPDDMQNFSLNNFFKWFFSKATEIIKKPFSLFANCLAIIFLCALFESFKSNAHSSTLNEVLNTITSICMCSIIISPIVNCITYTSESIKGFGNFMLCFIPVFSGIITMSGEAISALGYSTTVFSLAQIISIVISKILLPLTGIFLALSVGGSINENFNIAGITSSAKKIIIFILSALVVIFVGIFTIQNSISTSADSVGIKTAKFMSGSFIPIIGNSLGDAFSTIVGCLNLIKSSIGGFGILVCVFTILPPILTIVSFLAIISLIDGVCDLFKIKSISNMMNSIKDCLCILLAFLISYAILIISTTGLMITMTSGG